jgi:hypothetical protein
MNPSFIFLQAAMPMRRIFDLDAGFATSFTPSGTVPGSVAGSCALRSPRNCGEDDGPDCFSLVFFKVLFAKCEDWNVVFHFFGILRVVMYSPLI